ncbi:hypothetical protein C9374_004709 [Naegleria lovaniensis]|uniref:Uncharacterized protein n=1 Tax=Naegleria lovaniensis TaxID=51637 RepID=A0AA88KJL9_NAELO|nr:uncharacterized protein C9374_004709 [Naegleria lovaniensis]KAG2383372.1 hypothetical protein C9374_004709 [Naegleria lovaniensis]
MKSTTTTQTTSNHASEEIVLPLSSSFSSFVDREWSLIHYDQASQESLMFNIVKVTFLISSRTDPVVDFVPFKLYSSLKYKFCIEVETESIKTANNSLLSDEDEQQTTRTNTNGQNITKETTLPQKLLADIDIVNTHDGASLLNDNSHTGKKKEILKGETHLSLQPTCEGRKPIIAKRKHRRSTTTSSKHNNGKGNDNMTHEDDDCSSTHSCCLEDSLSTHSNHGQSSSQRTTDKNTTTSTRSLLTCNTKFQFSDVAYHHQKENICMRVSLFTPEAYSQGKQNPLIVMVSAPFQIYGRRTTEQRDEEVTKKRLYMEQAKDVDPYETFLAKKLKLTMSDDEKFQLYEQQLASLMETIRSLPNEEQPLAYELAFRRLVAGCDQPVRFDTTSDSLESTTEFEEMNTSNSPTQEVVEAMEPCETLAEDPFQEEFWLCEPSFLPSVQGDTAQELSSSNVITSPSTMYSCEEVLSCPQYEDPYSTFLKKELDDFDISRYSELDSLNFFDSDISEGSDSQSNAFDASTFDLLSSF